MDGKILDCMHPFFQLAPRFFVFSTIIVFKLNSRQCRCDCPAGICLDDNEQCYTTCDETIDTNPWAGCSPGWDCPWFPDDESGYVLP